MVELLNLGSGLRSTRDPSAVNIDWSPYLRISKNPILKRLAPLVLDRERLDRLSSLPDNVMVHDLRKGIPFDDESVGAVYHSHILEHIDREDADAFMAEIRRVLRPGGIQRAVVPDLELFVRQYWEDLQSSGNGGGKRSHDETVAGILEQSVRREAFGTAGQPPVRRRMENLLLGGARRRGETHQWMYDRINLAALLERNGFAEVEQHTYRTSNIPDWDRLGRGLDSNPDGTEYKDHSLYVEAVRA